jgi:predicted DNA-binding protein YlxM (UPF0122 family)
MRQNGTHTATETNQTPQRMSTGRTLLLDDKQFRAHLQHWATNLGSMAELARQLDVSGQFVGDLIAGRKRPGKKILEKLNITCKRMYEVRLEADGE